MISQWCRNYTATTRGPTSGVTLPHNLDIAADGLTPEAPADWIQLPDGAGSTCTVTNGAGEPLILTATASINTWAVHATAITACSGNVRAGTGQPPITLQDSATQASAAAASATNAATSATSAAAKALASSGIQVNQAADGAASDVVAETYFGTVLGACNVDPAVDARGTATASDTTYATKTIRLYRAGSVVKTWTITTQITGGTGNWTNGAFFPKADPFAALAGDYVTVQTSKASTGVQLPAHSVALRVS